MNFISLSKTKKLKWIKGFYKWWTLSLMSYISVYHITCWLDRACVCVLVRMSILSIHTRRDQDTQVEIWPSSILAPEYACWLTWAVWINWLNNMYVSMAFLAWRRCTASPVMQWFINTNCHDNRHHQGICVTGPSQTVLEYPWATVTHIQTLPKCWFCRITYALKQKSYRNHAGLQPFVNELFRYPAGIL